jgi:hypothetical protein
MTPAPASCRRFRRDLHEHHDGCPASPALATHLADCAPCRGLLRELATLDTSLAISVEPMPPILARRLATALPPRPEPLPRVLWMTTAGSLAVAAILWAFAGDELARPLEDLAAWAVQTPAMALSQAMAPWLDWSWPVPSWLTEFLAAPALTLDAWSRSTLSELLQTSAITLTFGLPLILYPVGLAFAGPSGSARPCPQRRSA